MGLFSFIKNAGEKLLHRSQASDAPATGAQGAASDTRTITQADAIIEYINKQNLQYKNLTVTVDAASGNVVVEGVAADQATREKIVLCCGNVEGIGQVDDRMTVEKAAPESKYYTVVSGDNLSKIAKAQYGHANKYMAIFEANKPMLKDPDKIYPGQNLRIPPL